MLGSSSSSPPTTDGLLPAHDPTVPKQGVILLGRSTMDMSTARQTFRRLWNEEQTILYPLKKEKEQIQIDEHCAAQLRYDHHRRLTAMEIQHQAMESIRKTTKDDNDPVQTLQDWGIDGSVGLSSSFVPSSSSSSSSSYTGRPLYGATSGALYLSAEHEVGFPPYRRNQYTYPEGLDSSSSPSSSSSFVPSVELRRPNFPDRQYPIGDKSVHIGSGTAILRDIATANMYDN